MTLAGPLIDACPQCRALADNDEVRFVCDALSIAEGRTTLQELAAYLTKMHVRHVATS